MVTRKTYPLISMSTVHALHAPSYSSLYFSILRSKLTVLGQSIACRVVVHINSAVARRYVKRMMVHSYSSLAHWLTGSLASLGPLSL